MFAQLQILAIKYSRAEIQTLKSTTLSPKSLDVDTLISQDFLFKNAPLSLPLPRPFLGFRYCESRRSFSTAAYLESFRCGMFTFVSTF